MRRGDGPSDFLNQVNAGNVTTVTIADDHNVTGQLKNKITYKQQDGSTVTATMVGDDPLLAVTRL